MRSGWTSNKLKTITQKIGSGSTPRGGKSVYVEKGAAFIRSQNVYDHKFEATDIARLSADAAHQLRGVSVQPKDVLICITGESVTRTTMVDEAVLPAHVSQHVSIVRADPDLLDPHFLQYSLLNPATKEYLNTLSEAGATRRAITKGDLENLEILVPPLPEQRDIAGVLRSLDELIDVNRKLSEDIDSIERCAFRRAWDQELRVPIAEVALVTAGQSPPGETYNETGDGLPFYQGVRDFGSRYVSERVFCSSPKRVALPADVLLAVRAPIGLTNVATEEIAIGRGLAAIRFRHPSVGLQALRMEDGLWGAYEGEGTVFSSISKDVISNMEIPWVESTELEEELSVMDSLHRELFIEVDELTRTRDTLLPLLLSGRISPKSATKLFEDVTK